MKTWIWYATSMHEYDVLACATSNEAMRAIERLLGPVRWWDPDDL